MVLKIKPHLVHAVTALWGSWVIAYNGKLKRGSQRTQRSTKIFVTYTHVGIYLNRSHNFEMSFRIQVSSKCLYQLENIRTDFHKSWFWGVLLRFVDRFQFWLKPDNNKHFKGINNRTGNPLDKLGLTSRTFPSDAQNKILCAFLISPTLPQIPPIWYSSKNLNIVCVPFIREVACRCLESKGLCHHVSYIPPWCCA